MDPTNANANTNANASNETETSRQEPPRTCTRKSPCARQDCPTCCTPSNHVRNLDDALNNSDGRPPTSPTSTTVNLPPPPPNHPIRLLTATFNDAIQRNHARDLTNLLHLYDQTMRTNLEFSFYDKSDLHAARATANQLVNSHTAASTPLPDSPPNGLLHTNPTSPPSASFKPPKLVTETWSGQSYEFYPWLSSILNGFNLTRCADPVKLMLTLQALPLS